MTGPVRLGWLLPASLRDEVDLEEAKGEWVKGEDKYVRVIGNRVAVLYEWLGPSQEVIQELMDSLPKLGKEMEEVERAWRTLADFRELELEFSVDGWVSVPYGPLTWFHGQESVNELLSGTGLELMEDYDGVTRVRAYSGRPYSVESLSRALKLLTVGIRMYLAIKNVQEGEAVKVTLSMLHLLR